METGSDRFALEKNSLLLWFTLVIPVAIVAICCALLRSGRADLPCSNRPG